MKTLWYRFVKFYIKIGLFFYAKKVRVVGKNNIPKKGAVLFAINHPNGLLDPLMVTSNVSRDTYYLVRAAAFKNNIANSILRSLNLRPIYRIRDGRKEMSKNESVFNDCFEILNNQKALMIFPEGSHDQRRTIRTISKGFTRILFGALDKYPALKIAIIPVGITYQNIGVFPSKAAIHFGTPIKAEELYNPKDISSSIESIKSQVTKQLTGLSVHITADENYAETLKTLNKSNCDFTKVAEVNTSITNHSFKQFKNRVNFIKPLYILFVANSLIPWLLWKRIEKKIDEREFIDTFKSTIGISVFPFFYVLQSFILTYLYDYKIGLLYFFGSLLLTLLYVKLSTTPSE